MILPQTAEYGLRLMTEIALCGPARPLRSSEIARATRIPPFFVSKVLRRLVTTGLLVSKRGVGGGFVLSRAPGKIRFFEILAASGYRFDLDHCVFGWKRCGGKNPCPLHPTWGRIKETFRRWAEETTLDEVGYPDLPAR